MDLPSDSDPVPVPRGVLRDILSDGTCPLHIRMLLERALERFDSTAKTAPTYLLAALWTEKTSDDELCAPSLSSLAGPCRALVAAQLPLSDILSLRACGSVGLQWAMHKAVSGLGDLKKVHDRIRARLWIQRVADLTRDTADETIFETQVKSFANDALRRRMELEMADAKVHMEQQIHLFQGEVDRRMEEQALRVHALVEERVQQQLDTILAVEMEKVRAMVEERVQERVRAVVQKEVRTTVCEVQARLAALARENDRLRTAFVEHSDLCFRSLVWALNPNATGLFARTLRLMWCCRRRLTAFSSWLVGVSPDRRQERLRARLEALRRVSMGTDLQVPHELRVLWGPDIEDSRRLVLLVPDGAEQTGNDIAETAPLLASSAGEISPSGADACGQQPAETDAAVEELEQEQLPAEELAGAAAAPGRQSTQDAGVPDEALDSEEDACSEYEEDEVFLTECLAEEAVDVGVPQTAPPAEVAADAE